ncbi:MAG: leucine--tRNA ligase [Bacilli bacterium]|nr:leucine--tRNA ligase [Bacilli bacterium]
MYNYKKVEEKWQKHWDNNKTFKTNINNNMEKYYMLVEFPYPSGTGLHVGHGRVYTASDVQARYRKMKGYNVIFPMGWDAFGAPAEQYAIQNHIHPKEAVERNIKVFKGQMKSLGLSVDWDREFSTTDPDYYKWTQWQFLQFYKNGMAYKAEKDINWCPKCKMGLSNEDAQGGVCERCGSATTKKLKNQWMLRMSDYAEDLLDGLKDTQFNDRTKIAQVNWIGKSVGASVKFKLKGVRSTLEVFTTRCDTLYGVTFMVISPEHELIEKYKKKIKNYDEVINYCKISHNKSEIERTDNTREKTGVKIEGIEAINPVNDEIIPIWVSDYVLSTYGTGAIMAVPAHDERDYAFAKKFNIDIIPVLEGGDITKEAFIGDGVHINSDIINGLGKEEAINKMLKYLSDNKLGKKQINYKLQDWIFSRQRFWGEPIPMIDCPKCGWVSVPEDELPVLLPDVSNYEPTDDGESPLANIDEFVNVKCPRCGEMAKRETDTMPNWAGSSWYWLRYMDPKNNERFAGEEALKYFGQVDLYDGGMEHATRHLLYARFWNIFLYKLGLVPYSEPFLKRISHGMILGSGGEKMSKSKGNVVNPNDMIAEYGADSLRVYEMFIGDYAKDAAWNENGLKGCFKFLNRVWNLQDKVVDKYDYSKDLEYIINKTIKKVTDDIENLSYNTAVSALMILLNEMEKCNNVTKDDYRILLQLLNPFAPHITEELNDICSLGEEFAQSKWPLFDESKIVLDELEIGVQVNGKLRSTIKINKDEDKEKVEEIALNDERVKKNIEGKDIVKVIVVPNRIVNIVVK